MFGEQVISLYPKSWIKIRANSYLIYILQLFGLWTTQSSPEEPVRSDVLLAKRGEIARLRLKYCYINSSSIQQ